MTTAGIIIDIVLIITLLVFGLIGLKKGLFKSLLSFFSWTVCIIIAFLLAKYVARLLNGIWDFNGKIGSGVSKSLLESNSEVYGKKICDYADKASLVAAITGTNLSGILSKVVNIVFKNGNIDMSSTDTVANVVGSSVGYVCMIIISAILIFIVLKIILALLNKIFDKLARTKVIGGLNKTLGLVFGLLKATFIVFAVNFILVGLTLVPAVNKTLTPIITEHTYVEKYVYHLADRTFENYVINGKILENWISDLWNNRV